MQDLIIKIVLSIVLSTALFICIVNLILKMSHKKDVSREDLQRMQDAMDNRAVNPENLGELLKDIPDLIGEEATRDRIIQTDKFGQTRIADKNNVIKIYPEVKVSQDKKTFEIFFYETLNKNKLLEYTNYIGETLYRHKVIYSPNLIAVPKNNPWIITYRCLEQKETLSFKEIDKNKAEYLKEISKLDKENVEVLLGQTLSNNLVVPGVLRLSLRTSPHFLIAGQTRSGKTCTLLSLVTSIAFAYPESIGCFYFADGKNSGDYVKFAKKLSKYPVAYKVSGEDTCVEFADLVITVWREYLYRQQLVKEVTELGYPCSTYLEMAKIAREKNLDKKFILPRIFLIIDEFASFVNDAPDNILSLIETEDSVYYYLSRLLRESASFGFSIALASQRVQATDFAPPIKSNLTTWIVHTLQTGDAKYLELDGIIEKQKIGQYILRYPGLKCDLTGENNISCTLPYVGDNPRLIEQLPDLEHKKYNRDIIYARSAKTADLTKLDKVNLHNYIKNCFLLRENIKIANESNPSYDYITITFQHNNKQENIGIVEEKELLDESFFTRLQRTTDKDILDRKTYWFVLGNITTAKKQENLQQLISQKNNDVLIPQDWNRMLSKAYNYYKNEDTTPVFAKYVNQITVEQENKLATIIQQETTKEGVILSVEERKRIANMPGNTDAQKIKKGEAFENFVRSLFSAYYSTEGKYLHAISPDYLFNCGYYTKPGDTGDLGLDSLFIVSLHKNLKDIDFKNLTDEERNSRIAVQIKNWNQDIPAKVIGEVLRAKENFKDLKTGEAIKHGLVVVANDYTSYTELEAKNSNIRLICNRDLDKMLKELETRNSNKPDLREQIKRLKDKGYSQREIAKELDISLGKVNKLIKES